MTPYDYNGRVPLSLIEKAKEAYKTYRADREPFIERVRDNERFYRKSYSMASAELDRRMHCDTPFIFSAIENARADAIDNFPSANILERDPDGTQAAELLSRIVPAQLEISDFKRAYKENIRNKLKYGTAVYGIFYNETTGNIDIKSIDLIDIYVDMHVSDVQNSRFLFISAAVENDVLRERYPGFAGLFDGDCEVQTLTETVMLRDRTMVLDCYYKKPDGTVQLMKLCRDTVIAATEDMEGYGAGLYNHNMFPVVFDTLYPVDHSPFGFGMIDIGKPTQTVINKLDYAITENIMCGAKPRYLAKRNGGIDEEEFRDLSRNIVHYEGDTDAIRPINNASINDYYLMHRERKKEELKEILANRDFQQGQTSGGVTAASAIETLRQSGEKRTRSIINDTYDAYKRIVYMMIELMRQFFDKKRVYRVKDDLGETSFAGIDNSMLYRREWNEDGVTLSRIMFDIDVVPQRENPYSRETMNSTIMTFWNNGMLLPENAEIAVTALKNMNFDGKEKLISDIQRLGEKYRKGAANGDSDLSAGQG